MIKSTNSGLVFGHPDFDQLDRIRNSILKRVGGQHAFSDALPEILQNAIDFVIDPIHTGRTAIAELDNVEKTFVGLKIEHFLRDFIDVPKGLRDLSIDGVDVDIKNTVRNTWMIPPETYRTNDPCLLIAVAENEGKCWLGLMLAREDYLNKPNRDMKRSVSKTGFANILWLIDGEPLPDSKWKQVDMVRFRELRQLKGGSKRAAQFFRENLGKLFHRTILHGLLFDQLDYMKRLRGNGGARDILRKERIAVLSGAYDSEVLLKIGSGPIQTDEFCAILPYNDLIAGILRDADKID